MSIYVYHPPACPMCETEELLEKRWIVAGKGIVRYSCPKCQWRLEGGNPAAQEPVRYRVQTPGKLAPGALVFVDELSVMTPEMWEALDQPAHRFNVTNNGADPLNLGRDK